MVYCRGKFEYVLSPALLSIARGHDDKKGTLAMSEIIPQNLVQCALDFDALNTQTAEQATFEVTKLQNSPQFKQCYACGETLPATRKYFYVQSQSNDGWEPRCKRCRKTMRTPHHLENIPEGMKRCSKCREILPATDAYFVVDKSQSSGLRPDCKKCKGSKNHGVKPFKRGIREDEKQCTKCRLWKPFSLFGMCKTTPDKLTAECRKCNRERTAKNRTSEKSRAKWLRSTYDMTVEQYDQMFAEQGGVCKVCKKPETHIDPKTKRVRPLAVDHDHSTGAIRALLCNLCNTTLGKMDEDPERIRALADYAEWCKTCEAPLKPVHRIFRAKE